MSSGPARLNLIDVGAVGGLDLPWRLHLDRVRRVLCFEPRESARVDGKLWVHDTAVWSYDGRATLHVSGTDGTGSSILEPNVEWVEEHYDEIAGEGDPALNATWKERARVTATLPIEVRALDGILAGDGTPLPAVERFHFLKSDTQGGEMDVLRGASRFLERDCLGLELELYRYPLYKGMALEDEVRDFLRRLGFEVAGWTGYKNSFDSQADYLFLRTQASGADADLVAEIEEIYAPTRSKRLIKQRPLLRRVAARARRWLRRRSRS